MKSLSVNCTAGMSNFFHEVLRPNNGFREDGKPYVKRNLTCGALACWILIMLKGQISETQRLAYIEQNENNECIFKLAAAYLRAKRGVKGYRIDEKKIVHGPNLSQKIVKESA